MATFPREEKRPIAPRHHGALSAVAARLGGPRRRPHIGEDLPGATGFPYLLISEATRPVSLSEVGFYKSSPAGFMLRNTSNAILPSQGRPGEEQSPWELFPFPTVPVRRALRDGDTFERKVPLGSLF